MDNLQEASRVQEQYKQILNEKKKRGFLDRWPEYERFKASDQWPAPTEKTKSLPRPVFNIIEYIENHKTAAIKNDQVKMIFTPQEIANDDIQDEKLLKAQQGSDLFSKNSLSTWEDIEQDELNDDALEDASNLGTCVWHYYWDNDVKGGIKTVYQGEMKGEIIDPMNYFPGNMQQPKVQKQPFIIISSRDYISDIKEVAKSKGIEQSFIDMITADKDTENEGYDSAKSEVQGADKATVLTKYWLDKKTKTVWFIKVCGSVVVVPPTDTELSIYPIAIMFWKKRKKCAFGIGDTEGLIPNQKGINLLLAMMLLNAQLTGFPKIIKNSVYIKQRITNQIGEIIEVTDGNNGNVNGHIGYLQPPAMSSHIPSLADSFMNYTKTLSGATETSTGELAKNSQMNATAIMLLQKAAGVPIEKIKQRYYQAMKDIGRIWEEFWKVKYNLTRMITVKEGNKDVSIPFNGSDYAGINMKLKIDIGPASSFSETLAQTTLDKLYDKNAIGTIDYLKYSPKTVAPFKDSLIKELEDVQAKVNAQAAQQQMQGGGANGMPNLPQAMPDMQQQVQQ